MQKEYGALIPLMALIDWIDLSYRYGGWSTKTKIKLCINKISLVSKEIINGCSGRCNRCEDIAQTASCTQAESGQKTVDGDLGSNLANNEDSAVVELKKLKKEMKRMEVQEATWSCHCVIDHLESEELSYTWVVGAAEQNHEEDSAYLEVLNDLVGKFCAAIRQ
ncbi:hypothetical protein Tco_1430596 [Tanacetum coccineum]